MFGLQYSEALFIYRWEASGPYTNSVETSYWFCRSCARLRYASEGGYLRPGRYLRAYGNLPRPQPWFPYLFTSIHDPGLDEILRVKPGMAGLWQISGRNRLTYAERRRLDLQLVRERNLPIYFSILLRTVPEVLSGENTW